MTLARRLRQFVWRCGVWAAVLCTQPAWAAAELPQAPALIDAVRVDVDRLLQLAGDWQDGKLRSPLLADGVDPRDGTPLMWHFPDGQSAILSNFSAQQNFLRVLVGLSALTGDDAYRARAEAMVRYYFAHYQDAGGLLHWGGHRFIDLRTLRPVGPDEKHQVHELKNAYPYYDLMFAVDAAATERLIRAFWQAHVQDWTTLAISRHGRYGVSSTQGWTQRYAPLPPFSMTPGLSFLNAGNDLIYAAGALFMQQGDENALQWGLRLAQQYIDARDPDTGLGVYQFTQALPRATTEDARDTDSRYGDRAQRQFGPELGPAALEGNMLLANRTRTIYVENALMQLHLAQTLGPAGVALRDATLDGLRAFARYAYDPQTSHLRPLLADGRNLDQFTLARDGFYGRRGQVLRAYRPGGDFMLAYMRAYAAEPAPVFWQVVAGIAARQGLGDLGRQPGVAMALNRQTKNADPYAIFVLVELYQLSGQRAYLSLAQQVAHNLLTQRRVAGVFVSRADARYAALDNLAPYALLVLAGALTDHDAVLPPFINGAGFTEGAYLLPDGRVRPSTRDDELLAVPHGQVFGAAAAAP